MDDLNNLPTGTELSTDVCIVGSGPAGLAIAREFFGTQVRVLVLESGTEKLEDSPLRVDPLESVGAARQMDANLVRNRALGGSINSWQGKSVPFGPMDYAQRAWVPFSGWPIDPAALQPTIDRASELLNLGPSVYDASAYPLLGMERPAPALDPALLESVFWQFAKNRAFPFPPLRIGNVFLSRKTDNIQILLNATVTRLRATNGKLSSLELRSIQGKAATVRARLTVLACGGIENARLLLASNVANSSGLVGRYLMDHLRCEVADFGPEAKAMIEDRFDFHYLQIGPSSYAYQPGLGLSPALQERERLLNTAAWVEQHRAGDDPWHLLKALSTRRSANPLSDLRSVLNDLPFLANGVRRRYGARRGLSHKLERIALMCMTEQVPDPDSRVTLSDRVDNYGVPLSRIDWRVHEVELRSLVRLAELTASELKRVGLPAPRLHDWAARRRFEDAPIIDIAHPTGTTRMADDPAQGVVDTQCKAHDVDGLYIVGSSVFPTAGHANPTLMITAMALRLADHLKQLVRQPVLEPRPTRVLVTGGSGRIGRPLVRELIARGYDVRVLSSRAPEAGLSWHRMDWLEDLDFEPALEGCDVVIHLAAELSNVPKMQRVNVEATRALASAAARAGVRSFVYASSVAVYGSPRDCLVTEDSPVLSADTDYLAETYMRSYAHTKLAGEHALRATMGQMSCSVLRPSIVCDATTLRAMRDWSLSFRMRAAGRLTNHVAIDDTVAAFIWAAERGLRAPKPDFEVFNLGDSDGSCDTFLKVYNKAFHSTGDRRFLCPMPLPRQFDLLKDTLRYRVPPGQLRYPLGMLHFDTSKLEREGFVRPTGIAAYYDRTLRMFGGLA